MKRRLLNLLTALSLLMCVAVTALLVRSYCVSDYVRRVGAVRHAGDIDLIEWAGTAWQGRVVVSGSSHRLPLSERFDAPFFRGWQWERQAVDTGLPLARAPTVADRLGFRWEAPKTFGTKGSWGRRRPVPCALGAPAALLGAVPAVRLYRRVRRQPPGHCPACGYDLRATPDR